MPTFRFSLCVHSLRLWEPNEVPSDIIDCPDFQKDVSLSLRLRERPI